MQLARRIRSRRNRSAPFASWYEHWSRDRDFDSIRLTRNTRWLDPRAPGNRQDIFDIPESPDRTACEQTSRWRNQADAERRLQLRAAPCPGLLTTAELCRWSRLRATRA